MQKKNLKNQEISISNKDVITGVGCNLAPETTKIYRTMVFKTLNIKQGR